METFTFHTAVKVNNVRFSLLFFLFIWNKELIEKEIVEKQQIIKKLSIKELLYYIYPVSD